MCAGLAYFCSARNVSCFECFALGFFISSLVLVGVLWLAGGYGCLGDSLYVEIGGSRKCGEKFRFEIGIIIYLGVSGFNYCWAFMVRYRLVYVNDI